MALNSVILEGRLVADPELKQTPNGIPSCSFTIAVDRDYKKGKDTCDFIQIQAWRQQAEFVTKWFHKGSPICISSGRLQSSSYTNKNGEKQVYYSVVANGVTFPLGSKQANSSPANIEGGMPPLSGADIGGNSYGGGGGGDFVELKDDDNLPF